MSIPGVSIKTSEGAPLNMPIIGMGTSTIPTAPSTTVTAALVEAIKVGYRHFDTAALYGSEEPLGLAITEALRLGLIASRDELFITTKLWCNATQRHLVLPAIKKSLSELRLEYVDLYLIHGPLRLTQEVFQMPIPKDSIFHIDIKTVWEAMEECVNLGLTKAIGVSNFSSKRLQEILSFARVPPVVNQVIEFYMLA
ncbi:D-galacturonate reductase-like protein [Tanacetum coccineum]